MIFFFKNIFFCFILSKRPKAFIWGLVFFCTMDGFFRILEMTSSELICTRLYESEIRDTVLFSLHKTLQWYKRFTFAIYFQWRPKCWRVNSIFPCWPSTNWSKKLTLSQPRGTDYAYIIILAPTDFQTFRRPWSMFSWFLEHIKFGSMYHPWLKVAFSRNIHQRLWSLGKIGCWNQNGKFLSKKSYHF